MSDEDGTKQFDHPKYDTEEEALEQAKRDAWEGVMEDPEGDESHVEFCIEYAAESANVEHREDEVREYVCETVDWLPHQDDPRENNRQLGDFDG